SKSITAKARAAAIISASPALLRRTASSASASITGPTGSATNTARRRLAFRPLHRHGTLAQRRRPAGPQPGRGASRARPQSRRSGRRRARPARPLPLYAPLGALVSNGRLLSPAPTLRSDAPPRHRFLFRLLGHLAPKPH